MKKMLLCGSVVAGVMQISAAMAVTCATPPSCADLGYTLSAPTGDLGYACSACPFDASKWTCAVTSCAPGYQTGLKGAEFVSSTLKIFNTGTAKEKQYYYITYKYRCHWGYSGGRTCRMPSYGTYKFVLTPEELEAFSGMGNDAMNDHVYSLVCGAS